jgi:hypothetical protein
MDAFRGLRLRTVFECADIASLTGRALEPALVGSEPIIIQVDAIRRGD